MTTRTWPVGSIRLHTSRRRLVTAGVWILQLAAAGKFLMTGAAKLSGSPMMVRVFAAVGIGQWFRYLTGAIEVIGAILLLVPSLALYAAVGLAVTMVGAIAAQVFILGGSAKPAAVLLLMTVAIAWVRRSSR